MAITTEGLPPGFGPIDLERLPRHVALIMDGNGRWAKKQGKIRTAGHKAGMQTICDITRASADIGLQALTLYAFSTENWNRPRFEVEALMVIWLQFMRSEIEELHQRQVCLSFLGEEGVPKKLVREKEYAENLTRENKGMRLNICLNYGSRGEIINAVKRVAKRVKNGELDVEDIDEAEFERGLLTAGLPDPDLLIRTSGEQRLSNFLLYQIAYTEFMFIEEHWPDFKNDVYYRCLMQYMERNRRFGAIEKG